MVKRTPKTVDAFACEACGKMVAIDELDRCPVDECACFVCKACRAAHADDNQLDHKCPSKPETNYEVSTARRIMLGIEIILAADALNADTAAEHDVFYCGEYKCTRIKMTSSARAEMAKLGWMEMEDSWGIFT